MLPVYVDETVRVQTVGAGGIGLSPAYPVEERQRLTAAGRVMMKSGNTRENVIPNPTVAGTGTVIKSNNGAWGYGLDSDSLPSASGKTDGSTLQVSSNQWVVVAPN